MACKGRIPKKTQVRELPAFPLSQAHHLQLIKAEALGGVRLAPAGGENHAGKVRLSQIVSGLWT